MISFFGCSFVFMVKMFTSTEDMSFCQKWIRMHSACKLIYGISQIFGTCPWRNFY